ncbi:MAG: hypothetical protein Q6352_005210 [Candidatus Freyrarchaeum guaymaensis]
MDCVASRRLYGLLGRVQKLEFFFSWLRPRQEEAGHTPGTRSVLRHPLRVPPKKLIPSQTAPRRRKKQEEFLDVFGLLEKI